MTRPYPDATSIAASVRGQEVPAQAVVAAALARIAAQNEQLNCFTTVLSEAAMAAAADLDRAIAAGEAVGPLAGVPFAVKNLFDIAGVTTLAGAKIQADQPPASRDATVIQRLRQAGAILVGALNMDEYAYGFVTENAHYGPTRNPHDPTRMSGGSSGGSAAAVAAGLVPFALGTDTNGSIRVPAALCGVFGLKPTFGRLSRAGTFPLAPSLDHVGPFTRSVRDCALVLDVLQGTDDRDPVSRRAPLAPTLPQLADGLGELRLGVAADYFVTGATPDILAALETVAQALGVTQSVTLPESDRARAAAYLITASEGAQIQLPHLRTRPQDFDPATRDRFRAGALIPAAWYLQAQRFRRWYRDRLREVFAQVDVLLAPTTPCTAPELGQTTLTLGDRTVPLRPHLGLYTQPLSFVGLPVLSVPVARAAGLPIGLQLITAPDQEANLLRVATVLEAQGLLAAPVPTGVVAANLPS